jgi:hypothetical protein
MNMLWVADAAVEVDCMCFHQFYVMYLCFNKEEWDIIIIFAYKYNQRKHTPN